MRWVEIQRKYFWCAMIFFDVVTAYAQEFPDYRHYFIGTIGQNLAIQMDLRFNPGGISGVYFYESTGVPLSLSGVVDSRNDFILEERGAKGNKTGAFRGRLSSTDGGFEGTWTSPNGQRRLPFKLKKVAEHIYIAARQGATIRAEAGYPYFLQPPAAFQAEIARIQQDIVDGHNQFVREGQGLYLSDPEFFRGWSRSYDVEIVYYSDELISLMSTTYIYTGGAHGNTSYESINLIIKDGKATRAVLADLFQPGAAYLKTLSDYCMQELGKQGASSIVEGVVTELDEKALSVFTLSPRGVQFAFAPYAVASYAEGSFFVMVPYGATGDIIDWEGPLRRFGQ
jgi:hypothetical protein